MNNAVFDHSYRKSNLTNQEYTGDERKEMALKRLKELSENPTTQDVLVEDLTEEQEQWLNEKLPNDPFQNLTTEKDEACPQSEKIKSNTKKVIPLSKYSFNGKGDLHEAVILSDRPLFIKFINGKIEFVERIVENTRILIPPDKEEYPYKPYEFESLKDLEEFTSQALN